MVWLFGRGAEPEVEVECFRRCFGGLGADAPARFAAVAFRDQQLAVLARLQGGDFLGTPEAAALLRAVLHDAAILGGGFGALTAFEHVVADGLFDVHVLARLAGPNRNQRVPVVARGDGHDVEVRVVERRANVRHAGGLAIAAAGDQFLARLVQPRIGVDQIRDSDVLVLEIVGELTDVRSAAPVDAGHADANRVVGPQHAARGLGSGDRKQAERRAGGGRFLDELAAGYSGHGGHLQFAGWAQGNALARAPGRARRPWVLILIHTPGRNHRTG